MKKTIVILFLLVFVFSNAQHIRLEDKKRINEAIKISNLYGNQIWKGFNATPFSIILIYDDNEYLINHPNPSSDFKLLGFDNELNSNVYFRKRVFNKHFLATFPAVNGVNCIVVGTPENTNLNSSQWIITLLHEHFHQYVNDSPNYFNEVEALNLSKGDTSGMWMLNYPFPYQDQNVIASYKTYTQALQELSEMNISDTSFKSAYKTFLKARNQLKSQLPNEDYAYFSFQLWQEGIARYTEYKFLELLTNYEPSKDIIKLDDYIPFKTLKSSFLQKELENISALKLQEHKRVCFYAIGLAEGLILDKVNPEWRDLYLSKKFYLENYYK